MSEPLAALLAEFVGTFMLVFTVGCTGLLGTSSSWAPIAVASTLMVMIYSFGNVSGGHLNPCVSLACGLACKLNWMMVASYILVQLVAGIIAAACFCALAGAKLSASPKGDFTWFEAAVVEILYTAMIAFVVLSVGTAYRQNPSDNPNQFYALAIGFVIAAGGFAGGGISGGAFNPAIAFGANLMSGNIGWAFIYIIYEVIGSFLAAALFRLTRPEDFMVRQIERSGHKAYLEGYQPSLPTKLASEFIGTFMLVLTVGLNVLGKSPSIAFSAASCLMCMIYALGDVSGGHFNPAVTLAVVVSRKGGCSPTTGLAYVLTQILAGIFAGVVYAGLHGTQTFNLAPKAPYTSAAAHILEFIFTFVIAITVLGTAVVKGINTRLSRNYYFALAIGFSVVAGGTAAGDVSGGSLNPAVSWGIAIPNSLNSGTLLYMFTFTLIELAGGLAAALVFQVTHAKQYRAKERFLQ